MMCRIPDEIPRGGGSLSSTACSCTQTCPFTPSSDWLRLFLSQILICINTLAISSRLFFLHTPPMNRQQTVCSKTSSNRIQTPGNHPKERLQQVLVCLWFFFRGSMVNEGPCPPSGSISRCVYP